MLLDERFLLLWSIVVRSSSGWSAASKCSELLTYWQCHIPWILRSTAVRSSSMAGSICSGWGLLLPPEQALCPVALILDLLFVVRTGPAPKVSSVQWGSAGEDCWGAAGSGDQWREDWQVGSHCCLTFVQRESLQYRSVMQEQMTCFGLKHWRWYWHSKNCPISIVWCYSVAVKFCVQNWPDDVFSVVRWNML